MQSVVIENLDRVIANLESVPGAVKAARAEVMEEIGQELLDAVQQRIGYKTGPVHIADVQEYQVGSGKGYVAVRAMANTFVGGETNDPGRLYAAGYVTNALENSHEIRRPKKPGARSRATVDRVPGKYMYRKTQDADAMRQAAEAARRIEEAAYRAIERGVT